MTEQNLWRPTRRRLTDTLLAALAPVAACSLALGGLTTWAGAGKAGSPPRITVSNGRVLLPYGDSTDTAALFDIANVGGADDRLVNVTSTATRGRITLSGHRMLGGRAAYKADVTSAERPCGWRAVHVAARCGRDAAGRGRLAGGRPRAVHAALRAQHAGRDDRGRDAPERRRSVIARPGGGGVLS
ncbi:copper chaperone PCu(A)C [Streptomyces lasalocidi]